MGIVVRQSVKTSLVVGCGAILGAVITWLSAKYIPKQPFGFTRTLTSLTVTLSQLLLLGFNSTLYVFGYRYSENPAKKKIVITLSLVVPLIATALLSVLYLAFKETVLRHFQPADAPFMRRYFGWLPVYTLFLMYTVIIEQYLGLHMKVAVSAFMREVLLRILNLCLILLYAFGYASFDTLVIGTILLYLVPLSVFFLIVSKTHGFGFSFRFNAIGSSEYKEILSFTWYHFLLIAAMTLMNYMDILSLSFYDHNGFVSVAVYSIAVFFVSFLLIPSKALLPASFAAFTQAFSETDTQKAKDIFVRSSINILIPTVGVAIILCCNLDNAVAIVGKGRNYADMAPVFLILMVGQLINIATGMNDQVLSITNYFKFNFYASVIFVGILYILLRTQVPRYGIYGAAISNSVTLVLFNIAKFIFIAKKLDMQPFSRNTALVLIAALPALAAGYFFPFFFNPDRHVYVHSFIDAIMRSSIIIVVYLLMLLWLKPSTDLQEYIASIKKNKRLF